jgi:hypothetical protein
VAPQRSLHKQSEILPKPVMMTIFAQTPPQALFESPEQGTLHVLMVPMLPYELPQEHIVPFCAPAYLNPWKLHKQAISQDRTSSVKMPTRFNFL